MKILPNEVTVAGASHACNFNMSSVSAKYLRTGFLKFETYISLIILNSSL